MARLRIVRGREVGRAVDLGPEAFLGRDDDTHLKLLDETCSRRHARIQRMEDRYVLFDLGSNNGSFVNGEKVAERLLQDGDQIMIGKTVLVFEGDAGSTRGITVVIQDKAAPIRIEKSLPSDVPRPLDPEGDPKAALARLRRLYEVTALLNSTLDARALAESLAGLLLEVLDADAAAVVRGDAEPVARARGGPAGSLEISDAVLERARQERKALLVSSAADDPGLARRESVLQERISSMLCAPLLRGERWLGAIYADLRRGKRTFTGEDLAFFTAVAHQAALAFDNAGRYAAAIEATRAPDPRIVGDDRALREAVALAEKAALTDATVLVLGESGTGKELVARLVHDRGRRRAGPFIAINAAALTESLLESELFGHEKGAFTGALRTQPGKFEAAHGGTLFLDEIGDLPTELQAKLLRVLQERTFYRVGGTRPITVDTRIVAATNRDLAKAVKGGKFREDLYYRLSVVTVLLPPLRARKADLPALANHLIEKLKGRLKKPTLAISAKAVAQLASYGWPGNVRELENVLERAAILTDDGAIERLSIPAGEPAGQAELPINLEEMEKICLARALEKTGGKKGEAAKLLGISWPTLNKKLRDYGLEPGGSEETPPT